MIDLFLRIVAINTKVSFLLCKFNDQANVFQITQANQEFEINSTWAPKMAVQDFFTQGNGSCLLLKFCQG